MSKFSDWFTKEYKRWEHSQFGEEDFLAFCDWLGYSPTTVLGWLQGDLIPQGAEVLSIAGMVDKKVYSILDLSEPDPELLHIYHSFSHLNGEYRSKLALALWEAQTEMQQRNIASNSEEAKSILSKAFKKWGFEENSNV